MRRKARSSLTSKVADLVTQEANTNRRVDDLAAEATTFAVGIENLQGEVNAMAQVGTSLRSHLENVAGTTDHVVERLGLAEHQVKEVAARAEHTEQPSTSWWNERRRSSLESTILPNARRPWMLCRPARRASKLWSRRSSREAIRTSRGSESSHFLARSW